MAARNYNRSRPQTDLAPEPKMAELLNEALTAPGRMGDTFSRFHNYSFLNQMWLLQQGASEPLASYARWKSLGRQVVKGASAYYILRPITVKTKELDDDGQPKKITRFKPVKGAFPYSMTEGEEPPEVEPREWSKDRALGVLGINLVAYTSIDGNTQGHSYGNNVAINPMAVEPFPTLMHELSHVVHGHTSPDELAEYETHRGIKEFEAESASYLLCNELEVPFNREESRAYIAGWLRGDTPPDSSIRKVFKTVDRILKAGYDQPVEAEGAA
ncbi:ArdC-like ssDNA-binding domain-containing protein [Mycolicibacterium sp. S3B2]|uniref:ArdC-like ssDNA-binding domain-containing protein n=1 Tax=Mycolicibacterium sp. S3B2 TaxID=3415120 RepID=UPI003C7D0D10